MTGIFPLLSPAFQTKLAQYALLTHRAAVLAALPPLPASKGRPTPWASQPPARQLQATLHYAALPDSPKVGRVVLRAWFQKKAELRTAVYRALDEAGYPLSPLAGLADPSPWNVRLAREDVRAGEPLADFCPAGVPVPGADDASAEEITLMAHLLGWSVLPAQAGATPPGDATLNTAAQAYMVGGKYQFVLARLALRVPPDVAEAVRRGDVPTNVDAWWPVGDWAKLHQTLLDTHNTLLDALGRPPLPAGAVLNVHDFATIVTQLEDGAVNSYFYHRHRQAALDLLARVEGLRHRQQPDFAPLAALRECTAAVRGAFTAEWPLDAEGVCRVPLTMELVQGLLAQANVFELLLDLAGHPDQLDALDETTEDFQLLEAAVPAGVLNALLLRKLAPNGSGGAG